MNKVLDFLANNPLGSAVKVGLGAFLAYIMQNITSYNLPPAVLVVVTAVAPMLINYLNPVDVRYGYGSGTASAGDVAE